MRRYWISCAFCLCALVSVVQLTSANATVKVNQTKTIASLFDDKIEIALAIENLSSKGVNTQIKLELLDTRNAVRAQSKRQESLAAGLHIAEFTLPLKDLHKLEPEALLWYRLRYHLKVGATSLTGIIALAEITPDMFEIRATTPFAGFTGRRYQTRVIAVHPITAQPIGGVKITSEIEFDDDDKDNLQASAVTNNQGYAMFEFQLPEKLKDEGFKLKITGEYKGLMQQTDEDVQFVYDRQCIINTDKLIYQPGQTMYIRALLFGGQQRALANEEVSLKIKDEDNLAVYRATLKTSRFGIASAAWQIPANLRLGRYEISFASAGDELERWRANHQVRISRYELPNFTVQAKPDRTYYLPNQPAQVEVRGEYLFGQPLLRGRVKVVRETGRNWNFREQRWDIEEEDKQEGELDKDGRFIARLNLSDATEELEENNYRQFQDVSFTAYITDLTTNRTEQRRFDVRLTKAPIHVYLIEGRRQSRDLPLEFYVSTFYADGTPASCQVNVYEIHEAEDESRTNEKAVRSLKTNRYGLAKVDNLFVKTLDEDRYGEPLKLVARDSKGLFGQCKERVYFREGNAVRIKTDKPIYRAGEPITVQIAASKEIPRLFVDVTEQSSWQSLFTQTISLINGRATLTIPYQKDFKGELRVSAYSNFGQEVEKFSFPNSSSGLIYPQNNELEVNLAMSRNQYRPGEEASAEVSVGLREGGIESALGITVFDEAVDERARTDNERGAGSSYLDSYLRNFGDSERIAGIGRRTLNQLDMSKPLPEDLQLVAEVLLRSDGVIWVNLASERYTREYQQTFRPIIDKQLSPFVYALGRRYKRTAEYPTSSAELRRLLDDFGLDFEALRDPWGMAYRADFFIRNEEKWLQFISAGLDKKSDTPDDFVVASMSWKYFKPTGEIIDCVVKNHHQRTGQYIRDVKTLKTELRREGLDLSSLRDPWGRAYQVAFGVYEKRYSINLQSGGSNRQFKTGGDDFTVWTSWIDYTTEMQAKLGDALTAYHLKSKDFPQNDEEFAEALEGFDKNSLRDGWGRPLYAIYKSESRYADRVQIYSYAQYPQQSQQRTEITPVTQQIKSVTIRSRGADGKQGTYDDFEVAKYSRLVSEQARTDGKPEIKKIALREPAVLPEGTGTIIGLVSDSNGAVIAGGKVLATNKASAAEYRATTDDSGRYSFTNLPAGYYELRFEMDGFMKTVVSDVAVTSENVTVVDVVLRVGAASQVVTVNADVQPVQTESADTVMEVRKIQALPKNDRDMLNVSKFMSVSIDGGLAGGAITTPRVRDYFPETLFWQPEIVTGSDGRAQVKFKLADNITTWKLAVIASTLDGRIAVAEREVRAFQPFFAELDPPPILTAGDRLSLPVVLRNYLDKPQSIKLQLDKEPWFEMLGAAQLQSEIAAGDARRETFDIRATAAVKDGKQRVTAIGTEASDAIEKRVSVHPDGEEISRTASQIFGDSGKLEIDIPADIIPNSATAELKIYPNLMAHVFESIEAIMQRPYGCGEQTISSAYPSLLALKHCKHAGEEASAVCLKARRYVQQGYEKLLGYREVDGGFTYWGNGNADFALTAYALQFLSEASQFIAVDESLIDGARDWLIKHQQSDGRWMAHNWQRHEDMRRSALLTAYVAQSFARLLKNSAPDSGKDAAKPQADTRRQKLLQATKRALNYLAPRVSEIDEPYLIAAYALAALDTDEQAKAEPAIERLRLLARDENGAAYWSLETNTPFYGWGLAGRVETTALVVRLLAAQQTAKPQNSEAANRQPGKVAELINRGMLFLLHQKDRYGVWHSTQATVKVLDTLTTVLAQRQADTRPADNQKASGNRVEIIINGRPADSVALPPASQLTSPVLIDISKFLSSGANRVELRRTGEAPQATAQIVATYYENWFAKSAKVQAGALRLAVNFDKTEARVGEEILCKVETERLAFQGYGMILAEIGLPPGADVDRASLELAMKKADWQINRYDVLPDRVMVYLWPRAGGLQFEFKFRQRFASEAKNASSILYDYYNPEARSVLAPIKFMIR